MMEGMADRLFLLAFTSCISVLAVVVAVVAVAVAVVAVAVVCCCWHLQWFATVVVAADCCFCWSLGYHILSIYWSTTKTL